MTGSHVRTIEIAITLDYVEIRSYDHAGTLVDVDHLRTGTDSQFFGEIQAVVRKYRVPRRTEKA